MRKFSEWNYYVQKKPLNLSLDASNARFQDMITWPIFYPMTGDYDEISTAKKEERPRYLTDVRRCQGS